MVLTFTWQKTDGVPLKFVVKGDITEGTDFAALLKELGPDNEIDLAGVVHVNSRGVREWLEFVRATAAAGQRLVLQRCSPSFVHQVNMISHFVGHAQVTSILAPYACPDCGALAERLFELMVADVNALLATPLACEKCAATMVFDDLPGAYFAFLGERGARVH